MSYYLIADRTIFTIRFQILTGFRLEMLTALGSFEISDREGMFIDSCFVHCQSESQNTWYAADSPGIHNKTIAEAIADWYFGRRITKEVDSPYPCDLSCPPPSISSGSMRRFEHWVTMLSFSFVFFSLYKLGKI
ncbi:hypothetical protein HPP92_004694 [Vanilla planifolia]|uniref:Pectin acetylesterase n=1 Tax=Vanilla planifolia TaxID=51239 RepID=A0A835RJZ2_VANPL|nr:hypothetical protein HPP92_004694 [Vanilla planifolia]